MNHKNKTTLHHLTYCRQSNKLFHCIANWQQSILVSGPKSEVNVVCFMSNGVGDDEWQ